MAGRTGGGGRAIDVDKVETWIFDLDNTLYPAAFNLFDQVDRRMGEFIANYLQLSYAEAKAVQKHLFRKHGTTLRGLMLEHGMDPGPFLNYVHQLDLGRIPAHYRLAAALARLPGRKLIFTNGTRAHAARVTEQLGLGGHFEAVFDIVDCAYLPKPNRAGYEAMCHRYGIEPAHAVMVEDIARNLAPAAELGMTTVWVPSGASWSAEGAAEAYVHHVAEDLADFLQAALDRR